MEVRDVVTLVLGSNFIIAVATFLTTFLATRMQVKNAAKQFEREFERAIVTYQRDRKREVRSEPLLKLRAELVRMADMQSKLASAWPKGKLHTGPDEWQAAMADYKVYAASGAFSQALLIQYDMDLVNRVEEIREDYDKSFFHYRQAEGDRFLDVKKAYEMIRTKIVEVQELINKRLEEL